jgi:hypothetical protein
MEFAASTVHREPWNKSKIVGAESAVQAQGQERSLMGGC